MFETLKPMPADPILSLTVEARADNNPKKVDLGSGVYKTDAGNTPVLDCVREAQFRRVNEETSKVYVSPKGDEGFTTAITNLLFGADHPALKDNRVRAAQVPGGCGALRVGAEFVMRAAPDAAIYVSNPTWANHVPLLGESGMKIKEYPYYDYASHTVDFDAMMEGLKAAGKGDLVLLHGCCHNPCGADLSHDQWRSVTDLAVKNGFTPFIDIAYQGFGDGVEEDAFGIRHMAAHVPEMVIAQSCSKNFGLYRERTGTTLILGRNAAEADVALSQMLSAIRAIYSMPPAHGAELVKIILEDEALKARWIEEVAEMRERIAGVRTDLVAGIAAAGVNEDFSFIERERGMFSFLGITPQQVETLKKDYSIYMVNSSRISVCGLNPSNMDYFCDSLAKVLRQ